MSTCFPEPLSQLHRLLLHAVRVGLVAGLAHHAVTLRPVDAGERDWDQWRGPQRDGSWHGDLPATLDDLKLAWEQSLQPSYSGPVTNGKAVFTTETVDQARERVTAFDLETGA